MTYPLVYFFSDVIAGHGFLARVTVRGRALVIKQGEWWKVYSVQPAGIAGAGDTFEEAFGTFRHHHRIWLFETSESVVDWLRFNHVLQEAMKPGPLAHRWYPLKTDQTAPPPHKMDCDRIIVTDEFECHVERLDTKDPYKFQPTDNRVDVYFIPVAPDVH